MPVIAEEDDQNGVLSPEFAQFLQSPSSSGVDPTALDGSALHQAFRSDGNLSNDFDPGYLGDWDLPELSLDPAPGLEEPDYSKFENWIPDFYRPSRPCNYCRSRRLDCCIQRGEGTCTSCKSLFRECSLSNSTTLEATAYLDENTGLMLDTLHAVDEHVALERGALTGVTVLNSQTRAHGSTSTSVKDDALGSTKRNGIRFPRHAVRILRDWLDSHARHPYPTDEEKATLERHTELKPDQIANWLANARRRRKASQKAQSKSCLSPSLRPSTGPVTIPQPDKPWDELNPLERWRASPPENEPAALTDIVNAVANGGLPADNAGSTTPTSVSTVDRHGKRSSNGSGLSHRRALSTTSHETRQTSSLSATNSAVFSHGSSQSHSTHGSFGSFSSSLAGKKDRRRRHRPVSLAPNKKLSEDRKRVFQCTFCTDTFKAKYDWTRHEKSLHLSLEKYICAPLGPVVVDQQTGRQTCVYCDLVDPSKEHQESAHNHRQCEEKGVEARTFYRKDHLRQHLKHIHGCAMTAAMESWKFTAVQINSRCGFCAQRFTMWQDRVDHLTAHFKAGARMSEWKGCRGLDPAVAAQVTNAMPPYLIGMESVSPIPFSATYNRGCRYVDTANLDRCNALSALTDAQEGPRDPSHGGQLSTTCWEVLTVRLGQYAKELAAKNVVMTDEMLQSQARRILYDSDDPWNQTAADNVEWMDLFKKAHGLNFIPSAIGGEGDSIPEDLETYGDLGLRVPFAVLLEAHKASERHTAASRANDGRDSSQMDLSAQRKSSTPSDGQMTTALATMDPSSLDSPATPQHKSSSSRTHGYGYLPRYRFQLPEEQGRRFQTITGPWQAPGQPAPTVLTSPPSIEQRDQTSTGAMMEFLGGNVGAGLPFSGDGRTSTIPLPPLNDGGGADVTDLHLGWHLPDGSSMDEAQLEALIQMTTADDPAGLAAPLAANWMSDEQTRAESRNEVAMDMEMDDLQFDDLTFAADYDMPEIFGLGAPAG